MTEMTNILSRTSRSNREHACFLLLLIKFLNTNFKKIRNFGYTFNVKKVAHLTIDLF